MLWHRIKGFLRKGFYLLAPPFVQRAWIDRIMLHEVNCVGEAELALLQIFVSRGDLFLDIGANNGVYSWQAAKLGARVIAFEPNPVALKRLRLLAPRGVVIRDIALSSINGSAELTVPHGDAALSTLRDERVGAGSHSHTVTLARLDDIGISGVSFMKIDVEGHEEEVLKGALKTVARDRPGILVEVEERHNKGGLSRIQAWMTEIGYLGYILRDKTWKPIGDFDPIIDQAEELLASWNVKEGRRGLSYINNFLFFPQERTFMGIN